MDWEQIINAFMMGKHGLFVWSAYFIYFSVMGYYVVKLRWGFINAQRNWSRKFEMESQIHIESNQPE